MGHKQPTKVGTLNSCVKLFEKLLSALKEKSPQIRFNAVQALGKLGDQRAIPALEELAKSSDIPPFAKQIIAGAINQIKNPKPQEEKKN